MPAFERAVGGPDSAPPSGAAQREALAVERTRPFRWLVRAGFLARAITYGLIGAMALALAVGAGSEPASPNQQGALAVIASAPLGGVALAIISAGLLAYALWKIGQGVFGRGPEGGGGKHVKDRAGNLGGGLSYLAFFAVSVHVLAGSRGSGSSEPQKTAQGILGWPGGDVIVGIAGGALVAISLYQIYDAIRCRFMDDNKLGEMSEGERRVFAWLGRTGLTSRALVFALIGYFLIRTATEFDARRAIGVDGALAEVHGQPFGPWLLGLVAVGLLAFATFSLFEARYRRL